MTGRNVIVEYDVVFEYNEDDYREDMSDSEFEEMAFEALCQNLDLLDGEVSRVSSGEDDD